MGKYFKTKKEVYEFILLLSCIIFLSISLSNPILQIDDQNDLFLLEIFNCTSHDFFGQIEGFYSYIILIITYLILLIDLVPKRFIKKRSEIFNISVKFTTLLCFIFSTMNFSKVIYPESFISSFDDKALTYAGYFYLLFLLSYILLLIIRCFDLKHLEKKTYETKNLNEKQIKLKNNYFIAIDVFLVILVFSFLSLFFVPFISNYREYMPEPEFSHILDKRTSIDYYFLALFDPTFKLTLPGILLIRLVTFPSTMIYFDKDNRSTYRLMISSFFILILLILGLLSGLESMTFLKQSEILLVKINNMGIVFITLCLLSSVAVIILSILVLVLNSKGNKHYGEISTTIQ